MFILFTYVQMGSLHFVALVLYKHYTCIYIYVIYVRSIWCVYIYIHILHYTTSYTYVYMDASYHFLQKTTSSREVWFLQAQTAHLEQFYAKFNKTWTRLQCFNLDVWSGWCKSEARRWLIVSLRRRMGCLFLCWDDPLMVRHGQCGIVRGLSHRISVKTIGKLQLSC